MESGGLWWMKRSKSEVIQDLSNSNVVEDEISSSLAEFLQKEASLQCLDEKGDDIDIGSILEEISRLSAKSPLGPYEKAVGDRSIEDIMREAEKLYMESSKSFEQLSQRSKTSQNISEILKSDNSTPTPKSLSPLPLDDDKKPDSDIEESLSYSYESDSEKSDIKEQPEYSMAFDSETKKSDTVASVVKGAASKSTSSAELTEVQDVVISVDVHPEPEEIDCIPEGHNEEIIKKDEVIQMLIVDNRGLKDEIKSLEQQVGEMRRLLEQTSADLRQSQTIKSPVADLELERALEQLKDTKEANTALQVQLDSTSKSHQQLKTSYDELAVSNRSLERRMVDLDAVLAKYKQELVNAQSQKDKLLSSESAVNKILDAERVQIKTLKTRIEKDSKCILDLNRQIKEMERIIARKHPDSVSALIVAAKVETDTPTARRVLEERIKSLENDALMRDAQNSQVFIDVQEKFNQMKLKYESHIDDLELHVNDLKSQLKRRGDTYDVYTQTPRDEQKIPVKDTSSAAVQTDFGPVRVKQVVVKKQAEREVKEETHLLATIRGLQTDLTNKEKVIVKVQKEVDELRKTNRRLQKEREGSLKNLSEKKEFRSFPERLSAQASAVGDSDDELRAVRMERDKMKQQLCRIEEDYQALKAKRLQDLNTLQEAHEREIATYLANITPLREQLEVQQVSLSALQRQLVDTKEELAIVTVERDHLNNKVRCGVVSPTNLYNGNEESEVVTLRKQVTHMEIKYEERENRLRAIVHGLAQKSVTNKSCEQCATRQQQLIGYKVELDQLIATLRCLQ